MVSARKATQLSTKYHNRDLVLNTILSKTMVSRAEIARITQLTRTTVSDVVGGLIDEHLVEEIGYSSSVGGKPSILLSLAADSRYRVGLNLANDCFTGAIVNLRGELKETVEIPIHLKNHQNALELVYQILDQLLSKNWQPIIGIGVGTPGLINTREGVVVSAVNLDWQNLPLAALLTERYHLPVSVMNDSQATAIGEFVYGSHQAVNNLMVVSVNNGVGAGILINGHLFPGDGGYAGEIGHITIQGNQRVCRCGRQGCLETLTSVQAVLRQVQQLTGMSELPDVDAVLRRFNGGDAAAHQAVLEAGRALGTALAGINGALNINTIVLTGEMTHFGEPWLAAVRQAYQPTVMVQFAQQTNLTLGKLGVSACILGASAHLLLDTYSLLFLPPEK